MNKSKLKLIKSLNIPFLPSYSTKFCNNIFYKNKDGDFLSYILEKRKFKICYNLKTKLLKKYLLLTKINKNIVKLNVILNLRLDNILFNIGYTKTIIEAKQLIIHKHILLNFKPITNLNFAVKKGDLILFNPSSINVVFLCKQNIYILLNNINYRFNNLKKYKLCLTTLSCLILNTFFIKDFLVRFKNNLFNR